MKKILLLNMLLAILVACNNDEIFIETAEQDTCEVTFGVTIPQAAVASRSFNDGTSVHIDKLTLLLFDKNGVLVAKQKATEITQPTSESGVYKGKYKVRLAQTNDKRIVHFVANYDDNIANSGTENGILSSLNVSGTTDAYWQRMELEDGVYVDKNGKSSIGTVRLIRNFACISVTDKTGSDFLQGYALVNEPQQGTVAPYYRNAKGGFPSFTENKKYNDFKTEGYYGIEPVVTNLYDTSTPSSAEFTNDEKYVYERNHSGDNLHNPTFVIVEGKYENRTYYYRVDIAKDLEYYNLLRNFRYILQINSVAGKGYDTAEAAKNGASYNNVDVELKVEEITDGSNTLKVTPTDKTVVNGTTTLYIDYNYSYSNPNSSEIKALFTPGKAITNVEKVSGDRFMVTLKDYGDGGVEGSKQTETFTIATGSGLSRKVRITLIDKFEFLDPEITAPGGGQSYYNYSFTIPSELVESMFPLELLIRESTCSFTPAPGEQMSVELIDDPDNPGRQTWCYKRVLKWVDYDQLNGTRVECLFKANETIDEAKTFTVSNKLTNEYFSNNGEAKLKVATAVRDIRLTDAYYGMNRPVTLTFSINQIEPVTINMENLSYVSTAGGTVSNQSGNSFVYVPDASGAQTIALVTTDRTAQGAVVLNVDGTTSSKVTHNRKSYISKIALTDAYNGLGQEAVLTFNLDVLADEGIIINAKGLGDATASTGTITSKDGAFVYIPTGTGTQRITFKTTDRTAPGSVTLSVDGITYDKVNNRKSYMKGTIALSDANYGLGQDAVLKFNLAALVNGGITINAEGLGNATTSTGTISSKDGAFVYVPTKTGEQRITFKTTDAANGCKVTLKDGELDLGSASCKRKSYVSKFKLSDASLGIGKEVTITFTATVAQKVWIKLGNLAPVSGSLIGDNMLEFIPANTGWQTITVKTTSFAGAINAEVFVPETAVSMGEASGSRTLDATVKVNNNNYTPNSGASVNILDSNGNKIGTCIYKESGGHGSKTRTLTDFKFTDSSSLSENTTIKFSYRANRTYETGTVSLANLIKGDSPTVTFNNK